MDRAALDALIAVERTGSFTEAARKLNLSQPALSRRILGFEEEVGIALLERRRGKAVLTDAGKALLPHAEVALASMKDGLDAIRALRKGAAGALVFAVSDAMCRPDLLGALQLFRKTFPDVDLSLRTGNSGVVSHLVRRGEATLGLRYRRDPHPRMASTLIRSQAMAVICAPSHRLLAGSHLDVEDLAGETWIGIPTAPNEPDGGLRHTLAEYGFRATRVMPINDLVAQKSLIEAGFGIGLATRESVQAELQAGRLKTLEVVSMRSEVPVMLVTREGGYQSDPARALIKLIKETFS